MSRRKEKLLMELACDLTELGYVVIPFHRPSGTSLIKRWAKDHKLPFSYHEVQSWKDKYYSGDNNIALVTGYSGVVCLDIDVTEPRWAKFIYKNIKEHWPTMPIRRCNDPKFAVVFRIGDSLLEYSNGSSEIWGTDNSNKQQIEYFGWHKQITVLGRHRSTGEKYRWEKGKSILETDIEDLPVLELKDVQMVMRWFSNQCRDEKKANAHWEYVNIKPEKLNSRVSLVTDDVPEETDNPASKQIPKKKLTQEQVDTLLRHYDGTLRPEWIKMGAALHHHHVGSAEGLREWIEWSKQWDTYVEGCCPPEWATFSDDYENPLTLSGGIRYEVKQEMQQTKKTAVQEALERYVLIQRNSFVGDLKSAPSVQPYRLTDMRNGKKNQRITYLTANTKEGSQELLQAWLEHPDRQTLEDMNYFPSRERIITDETTQQKYWNTYVPPFCETVRVPNGGLVKVFTDHIKYLFETQDDYNWIMDWMAHMVQSPYERPTVTPLHINKHTRTGRGWLTKILESLVGKTNTSSTDINKMVDSHAKNGYLADTVLVFVNEAKQDQGNKYGISDSLKTILTETRQNVDIKYGAQEDREIFSRFFIQSQHTDAIVLDEDGASRFQIFISNRKPRNEQYYDRLYSVLNNKEFINGVYTMLNRRTINRGWLFRSTMTEAKRILVAASQSPTSQAFFAFKKCIGSLPFPENLLTNFVNDYVNILFGEDMIQMNSAELLHLKKKHLPLRKINRDGELAIIIRSFNRNTDTSDLKHSLQMVQEKINKESIYA